MKELFEVCLVALVSPLCLPLFLDKEVRKGEQSRKTKGEETGNCST